MLHLRLINSPVSLLCVSVLQCVMFNLNGQQPAAVTNISLCFGLTITILVFEQPKSRPLFRQSSTRRPLSQSTRLISERETTAMATTSGLTTSVLNLSDLLSNLVILAQILSQLCSIDHASQKRWLHGSPKTHAAVDFHHRD